VLNAVVRRPMADLWIIVAVAGAAGVLAKVV
jgi:hypothetical protein